MKDAFFVATTVALIMSLMTGLSGFSDARSETRTNCRKSPSRIEYVFPTYRIGCWLGEIP